MARTISRAEAWERAHEVFTQVNFNAFDFTSVKESLLDYVKLYFPEDFNDYIESSEFIAILELFAYISELLAYRLDLNAHEVFITVAERKESILRLAKMISYKASRNVVARGLVKMSSIQTSETVIDSQGRNLAGRRIIWNDANNPDWKEQFLLVINRVLEQEFGTVAPNERVQIDDVLFELYTFNNSPLSNNGRSVFPYSTSVSGEQFPMEHVPVALLQTGPEEKRPERNAKFSLLYANDGLGDGSDTTGFMLFTKQGTLASQQRTFDGVTPNQTFDVLVNNVNETDLWLNNINPDTGEILSQDPFETLFPHLVAEDLRFGEWVSVDLANAQNILFNTNRNRHKYEEETLDNDQVRIVFGDGEFSDIPKGTFDIWYRTSTNADVVIPKSAIVDETSAFSYVDASGNSQTISFSVSLVNSLQNNSPSETIDHIRRVAPSVYYTQDRMVNGRDYNVFMLQDPSILKLRAINRTFAGDSKYIAWHDPRENYEDVKLFGDDLALYWVEENPIDGGLTVVNTALAANDLLTDYIQPLLCTTDFFAKLGPELQAIGANPSDLRCRFSNDPYLNPTISPDNEIDAIIAALNAAVTTTPIVNLWYSVIYDEWTVNAHPCDGSGITPDCVRGAADSIWMIQVEALFTGSNLSGWDVRWRTRRQIAHSDEIRFWNTNDTASLVNFDTLNPNSDRIVTLAANKDANGVSLLDDNINFLVLGQELVDQNLPNAGLPDIHGLSVLPEDVNGDGIPDNILQPDLFDFELTRKWPVDTDPDMQFPNEWQVTIDGVGPAYYIDLSKLATPRQYNNSDERDPDDSSVFVEGRDADVEVYVTYNNGAHPGAIIGTTVRHTFDNVDLVIPTVQSAQLVVDGIGFSTIGSNPVPLAGDDIQIILKDYVYFNRETSTDPWDPQLTTDGIRSLFMLDDATNADDQRYIRREGRYPLNFAWFHFVARLNLVDPAASNIIDMFIVTRGYWVALNRFLENKTDVIPAAPTPLELRTSYSELIDNKMISDTVILHPGVFKILFGSRAIPELRCTFKVIRPELSSLTDNEVKVRMVDIIRRFFNIDDWEFGETFFFTELAASIHSELGPEIDSVVLVPTFSQNQFGDMFQVQTREDELFIADMNTSDIEIVQSYTPENIRQNPD